MFANPSTLNFTLQVNSPCYHSGLNDYDIGAKFFDNVPECPSTFVIKSSGAPNVVELEWIMSQKTVHGNMIDTVSNVYLWRNNNLIAQIHVNPGENIPHRMYFTDVIPRADFYRYQICLEDNQGHMGRILYTGEDWFGGQMSGVLIWDLDLTPISGNIIKSTIEELNYSNEIYVAPNSERYPLQSTIDVVFVCLGIYPNNHVLTQEEGLKLKNYLDSGGNVYMEGGDTWYYDPITPVHPYFQINPISDGTGDLYFVSGQTGTTFQNLLFEYAGENSFIDQIENTTLSQKILYNLSNSNGIGVAYSGSGYKTIGTSFEFGGLVDGSGSTKRDYLNRIFELFEILPTAITNTIGNSQIPDAFVLYPNYPNPFNNSTKINFGIPRNGEATLKIYTINGQEVIVVNLGELTAGWHEFTWNGTNFDKILVSSGLYLYRLIFKDANGKKWFRSGKMQLAK